MNRKNKSEEQGNQRTSEQKNKSEEQGNQRTSEQKKQVRRTRKLENK